MWNESRLDALESQEALAEQRCPDEQHERQGDFGDDEQSSAETLRSTAGGSCAGAVERAREAGPSDMVCGGEPECDAGDKRDSGHETDHAPIDRDIVHARQAA